MAGIDRIFIGQVLNSTFKGAFWLMVGIVLIACQSNSDSKEDVISTEIVNNPLTASSEESGGLPEIVFEKSEIDFGEIIQGEKVSHTFSFTNTGNIPLVISDVSATCGCTVPTWPKEPVLPGEKGEISVVFDSNGKNGSQMKQVTVLTNAVPSTKVLKLKGEVIVPISN